MRFFALSLLLLAMPGCATQVPALNFVPSKIIPNERKIHADLKTITISIAKEYERLGETQVGFFGNMYEQSFRMNLRDALEEALARSAAFNDLSDKKLSLLAKVMKFQTPSVGVTFQTEMIMRYELIDRSTGEVVFFRDIASLGSVPVVSASLRAARYTEARNVCVRTNIKQFIGALEDADLSPLSEEEIEKFIEETSRIRRPRTYGR